MVTELFEKWAKSLPDESEIGLPLTISDKLLRVLNDRIALQSLAVLQSAAIKCLLLAGQSPRSVELLNDHSQSDRATCIQLIIQTQKSPHVAGYIMALENANNQACSLLKLPWWKLAWAAFRHRLPQMVNVWQSPANSSQEE